MLLILFLLASLTFFLLRIIPGGPFDAEQAWPPEIKANILHRYELDLPFTVQYIHWLAGLAHGDFRESFQYSGHPVSEIIAQCLPVSAALGLCALLLALVLGVPLGCCCAWKQKTWIDWMGTGLSVLGLSLPSYLLASVLVLIFSLQLGWLPPALWEGPESWVLPVATLCLRPMAILIRLTKTSMLEALQADYIRTAVGKGLGTPAILFKHALKNSLIPLITQLGPLTANLLTGSLLVELVFQIPGMGKHFVQAVLNRDYPLVMGATLVYGVILVFANLGVDLLYAWVDPRIQLGIPDEAAE